MNAYIIRTVSGHQWLIESAASESEALDQYYHGGAEDHVSVEESADEEHMEYLREIGQAS